MTTADRRRQNREAVIASILDAARQVMREDGVAALNLQKVAKRVGMRAPSLYEYFTNRAAIHDELFRHGVRLLTSRMEKVRSRRYRSGGAFIRALFATYLAFADEAPELYQLIHERPVPGFAPSKESLAESLRLTELGVAEVRRLTAAGLLKPGCSADRAFDMLIIVMHGLAGAHTANELGTPYRKGRFGKLHRDAAELVTGAWSPGAGQRGPQRA